MYYITELEDNIRVPAIYFGLEPKESILKVLKQVYEGYTDPNIGFVIEVIGVKDFSKGVVIPGDGAVWYTTRFEVLNFKPEAQEIIMGKIKDIVDFGAFINMGPVEGMIHISQTMDDTVSFSKEKVLTGKETRRVLKIGDLCKARIVAISFKNIASPKFGLTMRQPGLGKLEWLEAKEKKEIKEEKKKKK